VLLRHPPPRHFQVLRLPLESEEMPSRPHGRDRRRPRSHEGIEDQVAGIRIALDEVFKEAHGLLGRVPVWPRPLLRIRKEARRVAPHRHPGLNLVGPVDAPRDAAGPGVGHPADRPFPGNDLGMVSREPPVEDEDELVLPERHSVRVQEPNGVGLHPHEVVPEVLPVRVYDVRGEGLGGREDRRAVQLEDPMELPPHEGEVRLHVPGAIGHAVRRIGKDEVDGSVRDLADPVDVVPQGDRIDGARRCSTHAPDRRSAAMAW